MLNICLESKQRAAKPNQFTRGPSQTRAPKAHKLWPWCYGHTKLPQSYSSSCFTHTLHSGPKDHLQPFSFPLQAFPHQMKPFSEVFWQMSVIPNTKAKLAINTPGFLEKLCSPSFPKPCVHPSSCSDTAQTEAGEHRTETLPKHRLSVHSELSSLTLHQLGSICQLMALLPPQTWSGYIKISPQLLLKQDSPLNFFLNW